VAVKTLFARSCNRCAFPACDRRLTDPKWVGVVADIAHIRGERPGSARYAPDMTDEERNSVDNLMLLCPNHHRVIDRASPAEWSAERLMEIKLAHESGCDRPDWADDGQLEHFASLTLSELAAGQPEPSSTGRPTTDAPAPRLQIAPGPGHVFLLVNTGGGDAYDPQISNTVSGETRGLLRLEPELPARLSPGAQCRAGLWHRTGGRGLLPVVRVTWTDDHGNAFDAEFPMS